MNDNLFNQGLGCGACYEVKCGDNNKWCKAGQPSVNVTTTNKCGGCGGSSDHFDLSEPAFLQIAQREGGLVPIQYRRCYNYIYVTNLCNYSFHNACQNLQTMGNDLAQNQAGP